MVTENFTYMDDVKLPENAELVKPEKFQKEWNEKHFKKKTDAAQSKEIF